MLLEPFSDSIDSIILGTFIDSIQYVGCDIHIIGSEWILSKVLFISNPLSTFGTQVLPE